MYAQQPWYHNYPPNVSYNPYLHSSYQRPSPFEPVPTRYSRPSYPSDEEIEERRRDLAERRARRAKWLPDEVADDDDEQEYNSWDYGRRTDYRQQEEALNRKRALEMQRRLEQIKQQEEQRRQDEERRRQELLRQEALQRKRREDEEVRQSMQERRQQELKQWQEQKNVPQFVPRGTSPARRGPGFHGPSGSHSRGSGHHVSVGGRQEDTSTPISVQQKPQQSKLSSAAPMQSKPASSDAGQQQAQSALRPPSPSQTKPQSTHSLEEQNQAATRIQQQYRIHTAFRALAQLESQFETLKKGFVYPRTIDFQKPGSEEGTLSVPAYRPPSDFDVAPEETDGTPMEVDSAEGRLAYTSTNFSLHTYSDALDKLLMKLDGVESLGQKSIRLRRRSIVKAIEKEASKLDRYWRQAWADYIEKHPIQTDPPASKTEPQLDSQPQPVSDAQPAQSTAPISHPDNEMLVSETQVDSSVKPIETSVPLGSSDVDVPMQEEPQRKETRFSIPIREGPPPSTA